MRLMHLSSTPRRSLFRTALALGLALASAGCATSPLVRLAEERRHDELSKAIERERARGTLADAETRDVAEAVARAEITSAQGSEGASRLAGLVACADALRSALEDRLERGDEPGAAAGQVLLSAGLVDADEYAELASRAEQIPAMRALGARSLVLPEHDALRRSLYVDLEEGVRLGALRAASTRPVDADLHALVDALRRDPSPAARSAAARALGALGGEASVVALEDAWHRADGRLREAIAAAWALPQSADAGGRERLRRAVERGGDGAVAAALLLARVPEGAPQGAELRAIGTAALLSAAKSGTRAERAVALVLAPSSPELSEILREARKDSDPSIAIVAQGRLGREGDAAEQKAARDALLELGKSDDAEADRALVELAALGDERAIEPLVKALGRERAFARIYAARGLVSLGALTRAARLLGDREPEVRLDVACAVLARD
jgi:hypothetical protein